MIDILMLLSDILHVINLRCVMFICYEKYKIELL